MKIVFLLFIIFNFIKIINCDEWEDFYKNGTLKPLEYMDFEITAKANRFFTNFSCSSSCTVFLINNDEFEKFKDNRRSYDTIFIKTNITEISTFFSDILQIRSGIFGVIWNQGSVAIEGKIFGSKLMPPDKQL
jgi:hypothetical protein